MVQDETSRRAERKSSATLSPAHFYLRMSALFLLVLLVGMVGGIYVGRETAPNQTSAGGFDDLDAVTGVLTENYYYRPTTPDEQTTFRTSLEQNAIGGMLASLNDDYTRYLLPVEAQIASEELEGEYGGIGIVLQEVDGLVIVGRVGPDSPASRAGVKAGDVVVRIDNRPVAVIEGDLSGLDLRGPVGSTVDLTIQQPEAEEPITLSIEREAIIVHPVAWERIEGTSYMRIAIDIFGDRTTRELDEALAEAEATGITGIVLDLRGNGGGWVRSAQETIGRFLPEDVGPALYEDTTPGPGNEVELPIINGESGPTDLPLIVLVDGNTASAAEIVAGSLRDYDRALVIGEETFGKGSVQRIFDFDDGASLRVTVAEWFTPSKGRIQGEGIYPDVLLTTGSGTATHSGDPFVTAAVSFLDQGMSRPTNLTQPVGEATPAAAP